MRADTAVLIVLAKKHRAIATREAGGAAERVVGLVPERDLVVDHRPLHAAAGVVGPVDGLAGRLGLGQQLAVRAIGIVRAQGGAGGDQLKKPAAGAKRHARVGAQRA